MWVHEGFTQLFRERYIPPICMATEAGNDYCIGTRKNVTNDKPIIGVYDVNKEGSGDMYYKGGNMLHMIRQIMGDSAFRGMLRGLQKTFYHQTVTTQQIEEYMSQYAPQGSLQNIQTVSAHHQNTGLVLPVQRRRHQLSLGQLRKRFQYAGKGIRRRPGRKMDHPDRTTARQTMRAGTDGQTLNTGVPNFRPGNTAQPTWRPPQPKRIGPGYPDRGRNRQRTGGDRKFLGRRDRNF